MPFILDAWYVAGWPHEIADGQLLARTLCGQPLVLFRAADGRAAALEDRCCHRQLPLSRGRLEQGTLRCGYHGLRFDAAGACIECPMQDFIPAAAHVRSVPVVERHGWIWVWPGDPVLADAARVPAMFARNAHPDWTSVGGTTYVRGHYELISDNLLDLTHETYLHGDSLGNEVVVRHPISVEEDATGVTVKRFMPAHDPAPFWKAMLRRKLGADVAADRWQEVRFEPPANLVLDVGVAPAGDGADPARRGAGVEGCNLNAITPESEHGSWYFWAFSRRFHRDDAALSAQLVETVARIFEQDREAIEAVHATLQANPQGPVLHLATDRGQLAARRRVRQLLGE